MKNTSKKIEDLIPKIHAMLSTLFKPDVPGAAVIVTKNGKTVFRKGYGMANIEHDIPIQPHMVFRIGSMTKQFTAVSILMLVEQGKVNLDDEITKFLPDYPTQGQKITVEHLLTHSSGIKSYTNMAEWVPLMRNDLTLDELIAVFKDQPMEFVPDEGWNYNNAGYVLLGAIIEKASGLTYEEFLKKNIFEPLGMKTAYFDHPTSIIKGRVAGYSKSKNGYENCEYISMTQPHAAGSLAMSVDDLAIWDEALYTEKLLKQETLQKAWVPHLLKNGNNTHYGFGWSIYELEENQVIQHDGGINGFIVSGYRIPGEHVYVSVLTNRAWPEPMPDYPAGIIARWALGIPYEEPVVAALSLEEMEEYVGVYQAGETEWVITKSSDHLTVEVPELGGLVVFPLNKEDFFIKGMFPRLVFVRDADGKINSVEFRKIYGPSLAAKRTDKPLPVEKGEINLPPEVLEKYVGAYTIGPGYSLEVVKEGNKLFALPPGEDKAEMIAISVTVFFLKNAGAKITFEQDSTGKISGLVLQTKGNLNLSGKKVK
jgi:CubicO group peptidase (beta-lactamase class C family)